MAGVAKFDPLTVMKAPGLELVDPLLALRPRAALNGGLGCRSAGLQRNHPIDLTR